MRLDHRSLLVLETLGFFFIFGSSGLLHFLFEWTDYYRPVALIAAVNESIWEHLKIAFWPALLWAGVERLWLGNRYPGFLCGKAVSFLTVPLLTVGSFFLYESVMGTHNVLVDIFCLMVAIIIGQIVSYKWLVSGRDSVGQRRFGSAVVVTMVLAFSTLSYMAPMTPLHIDHNFDKAGILSAEEYERLREIAEDFMHGEF